MSNPDTFTISQFTSKIKDILPTKRFSIIGEVSQPKNSHGHLYLNLKDKSSIISATIWKSKMESLKCNIQDGDKITVEGRIDYYTPTGKLNFIIDNVLTNEGIGDLLKKYEEIKQKFQNKGYFDISRKKKLPDFIENILVLTSESGAAYQDFLYALENNKSKVNVNLIDVIVQGENCPNNICNILDNLKQENKYYDLVILTRGGGSLQDLFGFSQPELIESIYNFHLPVLSAIGHQIDNPLSDFVSDYTTPTPSLAAQFIIDYNNGYLRKLEKIENDIKNNMINFLYTQHEIYNNLNDELIFKINDFINYNKQMLLSQLNKKLIELEKKDNLLSKYESSNIILNGNGKIINNSNELENYNDKYIEIIWNNIIIKTKIIGKIIN